ncbi:Protein kinase superfamily protein [Perilla frutescens var. hirtella]|uniref:Protein kinase superfamily protein n=1 Tax=Perilla frutescens var. hirtella TaxID=608512 RepID=A0AAD4IRU3_PERFH|nr:Protein kinase superfamily protein [Perilla frutescens var. hirtella]
MAQRGYYVVGDYVVGKQIGAGSFSTVWHARHRVHGTEVAIKEIATSRLNPKLQESLKSEIFILQKTNHPNIIRLHDMIEEPGKIYIVLEYCKGGDLSVYIQRHQGGIPEATAKYFMQQLAEGLKVLRENNLIHRDLKPQNLLLSSNGDNSILKIADFGFARSLQPRGLAETLCGSPLYMAPEIMQLQRYDAKADLWSVGTILFQLVTGKTPFTGSNQIQLLQNIIKATELQFPPEAKDLSPHCVDLCKKLLRRSPVERLTFEEFFNHPYISQRQPDESVRNRQSERVLDGFPLPQGNTEESFDEDCLPEGNAEESSHEDCLPFSLDEDSSGPTSSPSFPKTSTQKSMYGFPLGPAHKAEITGSRISSRQLPDGNLKGSLKTMDLDLLLDNHPKKVDPIESIDQDYVIVPGPPMDLPSLGHAFKPSHFPSKYGSAPPHPGNVNSIRSSPVPIIGGLTGRVDCTQGIESRLSAPGISHGSVNKVINLEQQSTDYMTRISSLQRFAAAITELVNDKIGGGKQLEAFSVQLVILAIWKQALHICHTHAASAMEGSPGHDDTRLREVFQTEHSPSGEVEPLDIANRRGPFDICQHIERVFLQEVEHAEELAKIIEPGNKEIPDAMELIYQSALAVGRHGAVDEYMGDVESAVIFYSKAVRLFRFLLVEAPCLILNPPFSLTNSDRYRIENYINAIKNRQNISRSQRMAILKADNHSCPS